MSPDLIPYLHFAGMVTAVIAAFMISSDISRRVTGFGFILFTISSIIWVVAGLVAKEGSLAIQNGVLFFINLLGIYRYLLRRPLKRYFRQRRREKNTLSRPG